MNGLEIRRCASNCIQADGAASKCSNGASLPAWPFADNAHSPGLDICPVPPADIEG
jgi:hypothetical protein